MDLLVPEGIDPAGLILARQLSTTKINFLSEY